MTKFDFDAGRCKVGERHILDRFFKFVSLLVKNIVNLYMSIGVLPTRGLWPCFACMGFS